MSNFKSRSSIQDKKTMACKNLERFSLSCPRITAAFRGSFVWRQHTHNSIFYIPKPSDVTPRKSILLIIIIRKTHHKRRLYHVSIRLEWLMTLGGENVSRGLMSLHQQGLQTAGAHLPPFQTERTPALSVSSSHLWASSQRK